MITETTLAAATLSELVYRSWGEVARVIEETDGYDLITFFDEANVQCMVVRNAETWYVVFRGTDELADWTRANLLARMEPFSIRGKDAPVHRGFKASYERISHNLRALLRGKMCVFTGHSLGGALATLGAASHSKADRLITFGCPRVGTPDLKDHLKHVLFSERYVNCADVVARLPLRLMGYKHIRRARYFNSKGEYLGNVSMMYMAKDALQGALRDRRIATCVRHHSMKCYLRLIKSNVGLVKE